MVLLEPCSLRYLGIVLISTLLMKLTLIETTVRLYRTSNLKALSFNDLCAITPASSARVGDVRAKEPLHKSRAICYERFSINVEDDRSDVSR